MFTPSGELATGVTLAPNSVNTASITPEEAPCAASTIICMPLKLNWLGKVPWQNSIYLQTAYLRWLTFPKMGEPFEKVLSLKVDSIVCSI